MCVDGCVCRPRGDQMTALLPYLVLSRWSLVEPDTVLASSKNPRDPPRVSVPASHGPCCIVTAGTETLLFILAPQALLLPTHFLFPIIKPFFLWCWEVFFCVAQPWTHDSSAMIPLESGIRGLYPVPDWGRAQHQELHDSLQGSTAWFIRCLLNERFIKSHFKNLKVFGFFSYRYSGGFCS